MCVVKVDFQNAMYQTMLRYGLCKSPDGTVKSADHHIDINLQRTLKMPLPDKPCNHAVRKAGS
jgi:hypothetical protein